MQLIWFPKSEVFSIKSNLQQTFKQSLDLSFPKNGSDPAPFSHNAGAEIWTELKGLASYCKADTTFTFYFSIINA